MSQFTREWWPMILKNHGMPELTVNEVRMLVLLGEGNTDAEILEATPAWSSIHSLHAKFHGVAKALGLIDPVYRSEEGENRRKLAAWASRNLDLLYMVYMHATPDDQDVADCLNPACDAMFKKPHQ